MTLAKQAEDRPDVEAMIAEIRRLIKSGDAGESGGAAGMAGGEDNLYANLAKLNRTCAVGAAGGGLRGLRDRIASRLLGGLLAQINAFHAHTVRVLNGMVRLLDGTDEESASAVLANAQRRRDLLEQLSARLSKYDALRIEERLADIEAQIAAKKGRDAE